MQIYADYSTSQDSHFFPQTFGLLKLQGDKQQAV